MITASTTQVLLALAVAALGGSAVQAFRVRLDRRADQAAARARVHRRIRALLRRWPDGPPLATAGPLPSPLDGPAPDTDAFLSELADLTADVAAAWPTDSLAYTLERLMDAISRLATHPGARPATANLYLVCSQHLVALDLGLLGSHRHRRLAAPLIGTVLRTVRELRARAELSRALPPFPHGLPPLPTTTAATSDAPGRAAQARPGQVDIPDPGTAACVQDANAAQSATRLLSRDLDTPPSARDEGAA